MNEEELATRQEAVLRLIEVLTRLGFDEGKARAVLTAQAHASYLRYVEEAAFGRDRVIFTVECAYSRATPDFRGYTARLLPREGKGEFSHYFIYNGDYKDTRVRETYNLLCGRSVCRFHGRGERLDVLNCKWHRLEAGEIKEYPDFDYNFQLKALPIQDGLSMEEGFRILVGLATGDQVPATLNIQGRPTAVLIEADPVTASLLVKSPDGLLLDWKQATQTPVPETKKKGSLQQGSKHRKRRQGPKQ